MNNIDEMWKPLHEIWKPLYDYPGYMVSNLGRIKSIPRIITDSTGRVRNHSGKVLNQRRTKTNPHIFTSVQVVVNEIPMNKTVYIHRAVADHFIKVPSKKHIYATHLVSNYSNNTESNIAWITHKQLMSRQPNRIKDPGKAWRTRRLVYGNTTGSAEIPKWNPEQQWETKYSKYKYKKYAK